jgi:riboflavin kinase / FMN adenylyltransferase
VTRLLTGDPLGWVLGRPSAVAIGVFDGVHLGHRIVLAELVEEALARSLVPVALTFDPHPLEFLAPDRAPRLLTDIDRRAELLGRCGVEVVGVLPFLQIRDLAPEAFAVEVLAGRLEARVVAVGADFRFGYGRSGDVDALRALGDRLGFEVEPVELVGHSDGEVVSSSRIRAMLEEGRVAEAARLLGEPFQIRGPVVHGDSRGRGIGFPTANLHVPERMALPGNGVYAARARLGDQTHRSVVNIGVRPTFGQTQRVVEAHLLDVDLDLYGSVLSLGFVDRLRDERRFAGVDELVAQIARDVEAGRQVLADA